VERVEEVLRLLLLDVVVVQRAAVDEGDLSGEVPAENTVFRWRISRGPSCPFFFFFFEGAMTTEYGDTTA
jgi:hypothetical protein